VSTREYTALDSKTCAEVLKKIEFKLKASSNIPSNDQLRAHFMKFEFSDGFAEMQSGYHGKPLKVHFKSKEIRVFSYFLLNSYIFMHCSYVMGKL